MPYFLRPSSTEWKKQRPKQVARSTAALAGVEARSKKAGGKAAHARRMFDRMSVGGSLETLMQFCVRGEGEERWCGCVEVRREWGPPGRALQT